VNLGSPIIAKTAGFVSQCELERDFLISGYSSSKSLYNKIKESETHLILNIMPKKRAIICINSFSSYLTYR